MLTNEENVEVLIEAWKLMVGRLPGAVIEQANGVASMFAYVPLPFLNLSMPDCPLPDAEALRGALAVVRQRAKACQYGSLLAFCEAWAPEEWEPVALEEGFAMALNMTGMAADRLFPPRRALPELAFRRVADETTARDLAMINAQAYGIAAELFECMCNLYLWHADSFGYVGYAGGKAVTSAAAFPVRGTMYIAFVATVPEAHGKGYAEAVMRYAIEQAGRAMGSLRLTLHASDMGRPVYQAMGFEPGARVMLLAPADASAAH
jgi:GNAT superfamily N-acetyltransferase